MAPKILSQASSSSIGDETRVYTKKEQEALEVALDDIQTRFLYNLPVDELASSDRIFFQLEQAWWFYEDILRDGLGGNDDDIESNRNLLLPKFKNLSIFAKEMFRFSPMLQPLLPYFDSMWTEFSEYRGKISSFGCILLNRECTKVVLVKAWKSNIWTFPAGKVNQNESGIDAGARETYEETGFDPNCVFGVCRDILMANSGLSLTWEPLKEDNAVMYFEDGKQRKCYICKGVPESFPFAPVTRKEVSEVLWYDIDQLPKKTYAVLPFLSQLKRWIKRDKIKYLTEDSDQIEHQRSERSYSAGSEGAAQIRDGSRKRNDRSSSRHSSRGKGRISFIDSSLIDSGLASDLNEKGWDVNEMFKTNEAITGRKILYDGDPQIFASKGFDGVDPHSFRVVDGHFMNTSTPTIAPIPDPEKLQPLFHLTKDYGQTDDSFQPFFTADGQAPWDDHNEFVVSKSPSVATSTTRTLKKDDCGKNTWTSINSLELKSLHDEDKKLQDISPFLTDAEITRRHQLQLRTPTHHQKSRDALDAVEFQTAEHIDDAVAVSKTETNTASVENKNLLFLKKWVQDLPTHPPTLIFGDFQFDVDAIMKAMNERL